MSHVTSLWVFKASRGEVRHSERRRPDPWEQASGKKVINSNIAFEMGVWEEAHRVALKRKVRFTALVNKAVAHFVRFEGGGQNG